MIICTKKMEYPLGTQCQRSQKQAAKVNGEKERSSLLYMKALATRGSVEAVWQQMSCHPQYLESFLRAQHYILSMDGPLPLHYRHYIAIMAASRHQCSYLVSVHSAQFLRVGGDPLWLQGLEAAPPRLQHLDHINKVLAHQPWLTACSHIQALLKTGEQCWSLAELVHGVVLLAHCHALCSFVFGSGADGDSAPLPPRTPNGTPPGYRLFDAPNGTPPGYRLADITNGTPPGYRLADPPNGTPPSNRLSDITNGTPPSNRLSDITNGTPPSNRLSDITNGTPPSNGLSDITNGTPPSNRLSDITNGTSPSNRLSDAANGNNINGLASLTPASEHIARRWSLDSAGGDVVSLKERIHKSQQEKKGERLALQHHPGQQTDMEEEEEVLCPADPAQFIRDPDFGYQEFARQEEDHFQVFRVQDYSWEDHGFSLVNRLYSDIGHLLDERFRSVMSLRSSHGPDLKRAVWNHIHWMLGIRYDDYDYGEVNHLLGRDLKLYVKAVACYPDITKTTQCPLAWANSKPSERIHVNLLIMEARLQAELLYALRAITQYMIA